MPQAHDRHGRGTEPGWGAQPSRSQQRRVAATDDPSRATAPSRDKKGECKGPDGWHASHDLAFTREQGTNGREKAPCQWQALMTWGQDEDLYQPRWGCTHEEKCRRCGHVRRPGRDIRQDCPDFPGGDPPPGVIEDARRKNEEARARLARWKAGRRPRPPVTGRTSYRKPKGAG